MKKYLFTWIGMCCFLFSFAQDKRVSRTVTDAETGVPIAGVSVLVKGTNRGAATDFDGLFELNVAENATLVFSYIGYENKEISVAGQSELQVSLAVSAAQLDEVVVVAYGTQTREEVTASVSTIDAEELNDVTSTDVSTMMQGKVAGVQVVQSSGQPGSVPDIRIRGVSSIDGGVSPLWVVDGVIMHGTPNLNPNEIETLSVLKDASATSLYGSRGANGVVV